MKSVRGKIKSHLCPVCGYDKLTDAPEAWSICPSCGTEFENDDHQHSHLQLREEWIAAGLPWFSRATSPPKGWNPYQQLINAGYGADPATADELIHSLRQALQDEDYRYAYEEKFSNARIATQLKVLRESHNPPLTQKQLAERVGMRQSRISELENVDYSMWSISTLRRIARGLGVRLAFQFESWGELLPEIEGFSVAGLKKPDFATDPAFKEGGQESSTTEQEASEEIHAGSLYENLLSLLSESTEGADGTTSMRAWKAKNRRRPGAALSEPSVKESAGPQSAAAMLTKGSKQGRVA